MPHPHSSSFSGRFLHAIALGCRPIQLNLKGNIRNFGE
jgi:hypothetical protein